jgi:hypothetical protein
MDPVDDGPLVPEPGRYARTASKNSRAAVITPTAMVPRRRMGQEKPAAILLGLRTRPPS